MSNEFEMEFHDIVNSYMTQINHIGIVRELAIKYLYDFPDKLPNEIKESLELDREIVLNELEKSGNLFHKFKSSYESVLFMVQNPDEIFEGGI